MSTPESGWEDFENVKANIRHNTVDRLKTIIVGFNDECRSVIGKTGKKQDLIDRIIASLDKWKATSNLAMFTKARGVIYQVKHTGTYTSGGQGTSFASPSASNPSSSLPRFDPYSATRRPPPGAPMPSGTYAAGSSSGTSRTPIRFKSSPFFSSEQQVSSVVECPESTSSVDRRQQTVTFTLAPEHLAKLRAPERDWQLRLFCTSNTFYSQGSTAFRVNTQPCPIEFPPTCEIRVNQNQVQANTKGLKKKPGTAPPPEITKFVQQTTASNRVELVYVNSQQNNNQQPPPAKKYYMVVMLVQVTTVDQLVERLKKGKFRSASSVRESRARKMAQDDDDIVAGPSKISLKCPLSYMRITTPARSSQCVHPSCFDAMSWYSVNEQTTTWNCPICEQVINHDELIVDGYFDEILKATPESVEDVMVEADGEWHTSDDRYASASWKATHPPAPPATQSPAEEPAHSSASSSSSKTLVNIPSASTGKEKSAAADVEVFVLDSDDEDEGQVNRQLSPSYRSSVASFDHGPPDSQVIDLTLDSDDEADRAPSRKRKAVDMESPSEQVWKKSRGDDLQGAVVGTINGNVNTLASDPSASGSNYGGSPYMNGTLSQRQSSDPPPLPPFSSFATSYIMPYSRPPSPPATRPRPDVAYRSSYPRDFEEYPPWPTRY
ncbi:PINIT domain-containing protein [Amylostereum chailletii]|nr:PINIT domain-containing protein [Amylostereum chailletii]